MKKGSVFSDLASKITSIDGKIIGKDEVSEADQACVQNVSNTPSYSVVDKNVERIVEDVSTDADVSDAMRSDCNNDGFYVERQILLKRMQQVVNVELLSSFLHQKAGDMEPVIERGPWMIRKSPIILNKWSSSVSLKKGEVTKVLVWVKLYNVPVLTYSEDGLSLIATQIGKLVIRRLLRAIPEVKGDDKLKKLSEYGETNGKPPHYVECKSFGHSHDLCPKRVRDEVPNAPSMAVHWQPKKSVDSKGGSNTISPSCANQNMTTPLSNSFDVLNTDENEDVQNPKVSDHAAQERDTKAIASVDETQSLRKYQRARFKLERYYGFVIGSVDLSELVTYHETVSWNEATNWQDVMETEMQSMYDNQVLELVDLPS
ncbi:putative reverse transcriptase domain-containing protein [Tanacetum coccineum]